MAQNPDESGETSIERERRRQDRRLDARRNEERREEDRRSRERRRDASRVNRFPLPTGFLTPEERDFLQTLMRQADDD